MLIPLVKILGEVLGKAMIQTSVVQASLQNLGSQISEFMAGGEEVLSNIELQVTSVDSDTWYFFNMLEKDNWTKGLRKLGERIEKEISKPYAFGSGMSGEGVPFFVSTQVSGKVLNIHIRKTSMSSGFDRMEVHNLIRKVVRKNLKGYFRSVVAGGADLPEDVR